MYFVDKLLACLLFGQCISLLGYNIRTQMRLKIGVLRLLQVGTPLAGKLFSSALNQVVAIVVIDDRGVVSTWLMGWTLLCKQAVLTGFLTHSYYLLLG